MNEVYIWDKFLCILITLALQKTKKLLNSWILITIIVSKILAKNNQGIRFTIIYLENGIPAMINYLAKMIFEEVKYIQNWLFL